MPVRSLLVLAVALALTGCGKPMPTAGAAPTGRLAAANLANGLKKAVEDLNKELAKKLAAMAKAEGRKVAVKRVPMNEGRGAAELTVPLSPEEQTLLVQLYRLHPRAVEPETFPAGLLERAADHLATLHGVGLPASKGLTSRGVQAAMRTRVYRDGDGTVLAYEAFLPGDNFQLFGKYDTAGRILKVDVETWE